MQRFNEIELAAKDRYTRDLERARQHRLLREQQPSEPQRPGLLERVMQQLQRLQAEQAPTPTPPPTENLADL